MPLILFPAESANLALKLLRVGPLTSWKLMELPIMVSTQFVNSVPGAGKGEYAVMLYRSSFANREFVQERMTLEKTAKGWQVIGYFPR